MMQLTNILYVEDDQDIQAVAKLALEKIGNFCIDLCESGALALERLKHYVPQLILLDVMMPEMDGFSTFRAIRALPNTETIPIIFITAKMQKTEVDAYMALGAAGVIGKPFDPLLLPDTVNGIWEEWCMRNQNKLKAG